MVVATDLSESGEVVLRHGTRVARQLGGKLHVVNACSHAAPTDGKSVEQELKLRRARIEAQMASAMRGGAIPEFQSHVALGAPEAVIWSVAREARARVVVVGLHEHSAHELLLRNHTAEQVLVELPCSLLTIPV